MEIELTEFRKKVWGMVLLANGRSARDEHDIRLTIRHRFSNPIRNIRNNLEGQRIAAITSDQSAQDDGIAIDDPRTRWHAAGR